MRYDFASDNVAGIAPEAMQSLLAANKGYTAAYGEDDISRRAADLVRQLLDVDAPVFFLATGTAANAIALASMCRSHEAIVTHEYSHIRVDEAGATGFFGQGSAIVPIVGEHGRIAPEALKAALSRRQSVSSQPPAVLSLTNATEGGTVYSEPALRQLIEIARAHDVLTHLDGARLANAAAAGFECRKLARLGLSTIVVGGSKVGMLGSEALVFFDRGRARHFEQRLKQAGHLLSKSRFVAAPWIGMLENGAWIAHAAHANAMAARLARQIPFQLRHPVETNAVFVDMDDQAHAELNRRGWAAFRLANGAVRFMCSWATSAADVDAFAAALADVREMSLR